MKAAAANTGAGPAMAFMGMGMAGQAGGMNAQNLFQMGQQQQMQQQAAQPAPAPAVQGWTCSCGQSGITGNFCPNCGSKKPEASLRPRAGSVFAVPLQPENSALNAAVPGPFLRTKAGHVPAAR